MNGYAEIGAGGIEADNTEMKSDYSGYNGRNVKRSGGKDGTVALRRVFGVVLFVGLLTFADVLKTMPLPVTIPAAAAYFALQYRLLVK